MQLQRHLSAESQTPESGDEGSAAYIEALAKQNPYIEEWDGYDLDKTLFRHDKWEGVLHFGEPIQPMLDHLKENLATGKRVKIFTARVSYADERINTAVRKAIQELLLPYVGQVLEVTNIKDMGMRNLYDDRAWHVIPNEGVIVGKSKGMNKEALKKFYDTLFADLGQRQE
jgi:hypothetical protein